MTKEMYVSSTPHETKVAVVEDDQLAEIFYERENEYTLAGSIYKGRVTRVLPGMQSAFVDIGLERDAFLYVSDFLDLAGDDEDEFDELPARPEAYVTSKPQSSATIYQFQKEAPENEPAGHGAHESFEQDEVENAPEAAEETEDNEGQQPFSRGRRRRRGRRGRGFPESKFDRGTPRREPVPELPVVEDFKPAATFEPLVLPGESISKYKQSKVSGQPNSSELGVASAESEGLQRTEPFVIEGGFDDAEPQFESEAAQKQFPEPEGPCENQPTIAPEALEAPNVERVVQPDIKLPFVLPGESISKYMQPSAEAAEEPESRVAKKADDTPAPELAKPPAPPVISTESVHVPFVLPGESIAKYRAKKETPEDQIQETSAAGAVDAQRTGTEEKQESRRKSETEKEEPRTEVRMERRSPVAPFILPGESIAKYRRVAERDAETKRRSREMVEPEEEERLVQQATELVADNEPLAVTLERELEKAPCELKVPPTVPSENIPLAEEEHDGNEPIVGEHGAVGGTTEPALTTENASSNIEPGEGYAPAEAPENEAAASEPNRDVTPGEPASEPDYEQMNVAATFGAGATEPPSTEADNDAAEADRKQSVEERHGYSARAGHTLEEEEIEDEEAEYGLPEEEDVADYVELEEQTYEQAARGGTEPRYEGEQIEEAYGLTDAVEDSVVEEETTESAYPEENRVDEPVEIEVPEELADEEFEESELDADQEHGGMVLGRAEAASGAYPQRHPRPDYDRRGGRGRRGGRRMRGGARRESPRPVPMISELLKEGQEVLIQIAKEPIGKKGARITSHIALPGRYLVYMPTVNHIGVSRKITSDEERQRLKRIMISEREGGHGGFIVRTAAEGITEEELRADIRFLKNLWSDIRSRAESSKAPALIYHDLNLVERVLRDQVTADFSAIWVDTEQEYERILRFANRFQPQLVRKVKLYTKSTPLFDQFGIQTEIDKALKSKVWLKSGGYIVINQTEALVAIDVNTGKYVGKTSRLEDTIVKTNVDAIREIVRQIRLRDLGGIIVVDFIDMDERKNRQKVMQALEEAMRSDRAPSKVLAFNDFGLVAITRKRVKQSLERTLGEPCSCCTGTGLVKSTTTMCNEIYVEMRKMARQLEHEDVVLRVNPEVAKALKANGGKWVQEMEELTQRTIIVKSDPLLHPEHFDIQS